MVTRPVKPLIAIVGATGTGKSDLAVEIARLHNGEIINGDAMQLYQGLPIITNKITPEETKGVPHHLLGCIGLEEETWTVGKFVTKALGIIDEIRSRGKLPILVGGTHYYTQALLFQDALADEPGLDLNEESKSFPILEESTETILEKLREVDPVMADRWHPNDRRKIQRSLEMYLRTGKPASQIYHEQRSRRETSSDVNGLEIATDGKPGFTLRFPTLIFWVHASKKETLDPRLDNRIQKMLDRGLLAEVGTLSKFRATHEAQTGTTIDQGRGIWVSIGYKEFLDYQAALKDGTHTEAELENIRIAAIEKTQATTRQYARSQIRWIRIKLLNSLPAASPTQAPTIFLLDGSDLTLWETQVLQRAREISSIFLSGKPLPDPTTLSSAAAEMLIPKREYDLSQRPDLWQRRKCETCGTVSTTENDWKLHGASRAHRKAVGVKKKAENKERARRQASENGITTVRKDLIEILETSMGFIEEENI
ncbi:tRNA isopentenyltransferas-like protein [Pleomassaria siparia CBS 279.74]|uniref:tRNA dimethylallyltransferase n=1 Tax=Pleomassaria siparia CBS 279.74 TaxID=1314801 RepID=A0A6G1KCI7_9PLEO|nr:tRNA isopentenyltransferas-like protein [Pleomassaria siparia CBS 279.74]